MDLLISSGGDFRLVDTFGRLPLHYAASMLINFQEKCIEFRIQKTVENIIILISNLFYDAISGQSHYQCLYTLASVGSSVSLQDVSGCTALHYAAASDLDGKCVEYLLKRKSDIATLDKQGYSVLHYAAAGKKINL